MTRLAARRSIDRVLALIERFGFLYVANVAVWWIVSGFVWSLGRLFRSAAIARKVEPEHAPPAETRQGVVYTLTRSLVALTAVQTIILSLLPAAPEGGPVRPLAIVLEVLAGMVVFDLAFYVSHRLLHTRWLWPLHEVHHRYRLVSFWVRNTEHVGQVFVVALFAAPVSLILADPEATIVYFLLSTSWNVIQHSGVEVFPRWPWVARVFVTSTHHSMHHTEVDCNFGYFFNFWDQVFGTLHPDYRAKFLRESEAAAAPASATR